MKNLLFLLFLFAGLHVSAQTKTLKTVDMSGKDYYPQIILLNAGNVNNQNQFYRAIVIISEIYQSIIIEKLSTGDEGGNIKVIQRRKIEMDSFCTAFHLSSETADIKFLKWLKSDAFTVDISGKKFAFNNIGAVAPQAIHC